MFVVVFWAFILIQAFFFAIVLIVAGNRHPARRPLVRVIVRRVQDGDAPARAGLGRDARGQENIKLPVPLKVDYDDERLYDIDSDERANRIDIRPERDERRTLETMTGVKTGIKRDGYIGRVRVASTIEFDRGTQTGL